MDVLVCLAERAGKTVTKDEVFASVWSGQFVTESALARCIAELRQTLGDDARRPRFIETIPKRGYRLLMPITSPGPAGTDRHEPVRPSGPRAAVLEPAPTPRLVVTPAPPVAAPDSGRAGRSRHRWRWLVGVGFAGALVVSLLVWKSLLVPVQSRSETLIVSVDNTTGRPGV